jgi:hypothetical protein
MKSTYWGSSSDVLFWFLNDDGRPFGPQPNDELQLEYFVPLEQAQEAMHAVHAIAREWGVLVGGSGNGIAAVDNGNANGSGVGSGGEGQAAQQASQAAQSVQSARPLLLYSELRAVAADNLWLSQTSTTATGNGDTLALAFGMNKSAGTAKVKACAADMEAALAPYNPKPHWGKLSAFSASERMAKYGRGGELFKELCYQHDPAGKFRNAAIDALFE